MSRDPHQAAEEREHGSPDQVNVDRGGDSEGGIGTGEESRAKQEETDQGEHHADRVADIEAHRGFR